MPSWSPNWVDVRFDHAAAEAAAEACERAAHVVRESSWRRHAIATAAQVAGIGPWRDHFDERLAALAQRAEAVEATLRSTARMLRDASAQARTEQSARVSGRQQWTLEASVELAAAADAPAPP